VHSNNNNNNNNNNVLNSKNNLANSVIILWVVTPCSLAEMHSCFEEKCRLYLLTRK